MGHVLNNTLQDILVRFQRMEGEEHALDAGHRPRRHRDAERGREAARQRRARRGTTSGARRSSQRVWDVEGAVRRHRSCASSSASARRATGRASASRWTRGSRSAVREVFVRLYEKGLIYRGNRIIHWCVRCQTALSDEEAVTTEGGEPGSLWYIRYPVERTAGRAWWWRRRGRRRCSATPAWR